MNVTRTGSFTPLKRRRANPPTGENRPHDSYLGSITQAPRLSRVQPTAKKNSPLQMLKSAGTAAARFVAGAAAGALPLVGLISNSSGAIAEGGGGGVASNLGALANLGACGALAVGAAFGPTALAGVGIASLFALSKGLLATSAICGGLSFARGT